MLYDEPPITLTAWSILIEDTHYPFATLDRVRYWSKYRHKTTLSDAGVYTMAVGVGLALPLPYIGVILIVMGYLLWQITEKPNEDNARYTYTVNVWTQDGELHVHQFTTRKPLSSTTARALRWRE